MGRLDISFPQGALPHGVVGGIPVYFVLEKNRTSLFGCNIYKVVQYPSRQLQTDIVLLCTIDLYSIHNLRNNILKINVPSSARSVDNLVSLDNSVSSFCRWSSPFNPEIIIQMNGIGQVNDSALNLGPGRFNYIFSCLF